MKLTRAEYERLSHEDKREHLAALDPEDVEELFTAPKSALTLPGVAPKVVTVAGPRVVDRRVDLNPLLILLILILAGPSWEWVSGKWARAPVAGADTDSAPTTPSPAIMVSAPTPVVTTMTEVSAMPVATQPTVAPVIAATTVKPAVKSTKVVQPPNTRLVTYLVEGSQGSVNVRYLDETGHLVEKMVNIPFTVKLFMPYNADFSLSAHNPTMQNMDLRTTVFLDGIIYKKDERIGAMNEAMVTGVVLKNQ
jgi:hypothetical protein